MALLFLLIATLCILIVHLQAFLVPSGGGLANQILGPAKLYGLMDVLNKITPFETPPARQVTYISATPASTYTSSGPYADVSQYAVGPSVTYQVTPPSPPPPPYTVYSGPSQSSSYGNLYTPASNPYPPYPSGTSNSVGSYNVGYSGVVAGSYVTPNPLNPLNAYTTTTPSIGFYPGPGVTLNYNGNQYYSNAGNSGYQATPPSYSNTGNNGYQAPPSPGGPSYSSGGNGYVPTLSVSPVFFLPVAPTPAYSSPTVNYNYIPSNGDSLPALASYQPPVRPIPLSTQGNSYSNGSPVASSYPSGATISPVTAGTSSGGGCSGTYNQVGGYNNCNVGINNNNGVGDGASTYQASVGPSYTSSSNQVGPSGYPGSMNIPYSPNGVAYPSGIPPIPYPPEIPPPPSGTAFYPPPTELPGGGGGPVNQGGNYGYSGGGTYPLISSSGGQYGGSGGGYPQQTLGGTGPYVPSTDFTAGYQGDKQLSYGPGSTDFENHNNGGTDTGYGGSNGQYNTFQGLGSGRPYRDPSGGISLSYNGYGSQSAYSNTQNSPYPSPVGGSTSYSPPSTHGQPVAPYDQSGPFNYGDSDRFSNGYEGSQLSDLSSTDLLALLNKHGSRLSGYRGNHRQGYNSVYPNSLDGDNSASNRPFLLTAGQSDLNGGSFGEQQSLNSGNDNGNIISLASLGPVSESDAILVLALDSLLQDKSKRKNQLGREITPDVSQKSTVQELKGEQWLWNQFLTKATAAIKQRLPT